MLWGKQGSSVRVPSKGLYLVLDGHVVKLDPNLVRITSPADTIDSDWVTID